MQSYYSMLSDRLNVGEIIPKTYKPTFRSSAIFNAFHNTNISTRILFMGYWLLKRNITSIGLLINLRNSKGELIFRKFMEIKSPKAFRIEVFDLLKESNIENDIFEGSIELEIFSAVDLIYPYPAFVLNYYNDEFCTSVHSMGRVYNDFEDFNRNNEYEVNESGWDIQSTPELSGFFAFVNGPKVYESGEIYYEVINSDNESIVGKFNIGTVLPFESKKINLNKSINGIGGFLNGSVGTIKIGHKFDSFFPRFLVGIENVVNKELSITHSYYDSSNLKDNNAYWNRMSSDFYDSSIAIPTYYKHGLVTKLVIYPIFSPSSFTISLRFFNMDGNEVGYLRDFLFVHENDQKFRTLDISKVINDHNLFINAPNSVHIECNWEDKQKIPTRLKFGLNVGYENAISCNICFAPQLGNPNILLKKGTFKWSPILNHTSSEIVITNSSSLKDYGDIASVKLMFYNELNEVPIERSYEINPFGILVINTKDDNELKRFVENQTAWLTITSSNPNIYGWYFDFSKSGIVAGDHIF